MVNSKAKINGGALYLNAASTLKIQNSDFQLYFAPKEGSFMHSEAINLVFNHDHNFYKCLSAAYVFTPTLEN